MSVVEVRVDRESILIVSAGNACVINFRGYGLVGKVCYPLRYASLFLFYLDHQRWSSQFTYGAASPSGGRATTTPTPMRTLSVVRGYCAELRRTVSVPMPAIRENDTMTFAVLCLCFVLQIAQLHNCNI